MKYILDFDDTIFDAKKLKNILKECGIAEDRVSETTFDEIEKIKPDFDIKSLLFPDALEFLKKHKDNCEIVTTYLSRDPQKNGNRLARKNFQIQKLALCGITKLLGENHVHVVEESKKEILEELKKSFESEIPPKKCVYVDDRKNYLEVAHALGIPVYRMEREGYTWGVENFLSTSEKGAIRSFAKFESLVEADLADNEVFS